MELHGAPVEAADVDVLMSVADARTTLSTRGILQTQDGGTGQFRSEVFGTVTGAALPIDVLAGFEVRKGHHWVPVRFVTAQAVTLPFGTVYLPTLHELTAVTRLLGRPKDVERARFLEGLSGNENGRPL